jgi:phosphoribosylformylglycinamidine synthase subunit PurS
MKAKIHVTLKSGILDPQGRAIQQSLATLGFSTVNDVRVGKFLEVDLGESDQSQAETQLKAMCEKLLANTVIEDYRYELIG